MPRLLKLPFEYCICQVCTVGDDEHRYYGTRCDRWDGSPVAHEVEGAPKPLRSKRDLLVVVDTDPPRYERVERHFCNTHELLYLPGETCPQCAQPPMRRPRSTWVWAPTGFMSIPAEEQDIVYEQAEEPDANTDAGNDDHHGND